GWEFLEYLIDPHQDPPEFMHGFRIVGRMNVVLFKWSGIGNLARHRPDLHRYTELGKGGHEVLIELGDTLCLERHCDDAAFAGFDQELVVDEIKAHLNCSQD